MWRQHTELYEQQLIKIQDCNKTNVTEGTLYNKMRRLSRATQWERAKNEWPFSSSSSSHPELWKFGGHGLLGSSQLLSHYSCPKATAIKRWYTSNSQLHGTLDILINFPTKDKWNCKSERQNISLKGAIRWPKSKKHFNANLEDTRGGKSALILVLFCIPGGYELGHSQAPMMQ